MNKTEKKYLKKFIKNLDLFSLLSWLEFEKLEYTVIRYEDYAEIQVLNLYDIYTNKKLKCKRLIFEEEK